MERLLCEGGEHGSLMLREEGSQVGSSLKQAQAPQPVSPGSNPSLTTRGHWVTLSFFIYKMDINLKIAEGFQSLVYTGAFCMYNNSTGVSKGRSNLGFKKPK